MLNKKFVKLNKILFLSFIMISATLFSACGNNDDLNDNQNESTLPTTTLSFQESLEESMEKESIRKESFESLKESIKESQSKEEESIAESVSLHVAEVESMMKEESQYKETRDEYIKNKRESIKNINIDEIVKAYEESRDKETTTKEEVTNED